MLNEQGDIRAVSSSSYRGALEKARKLTPDVVLLDVGLRSRNSLRVLEAIKKQHPHTEVVIMDLIPARSEVAEYVKAGVSGFISKNATQDDFLRSIRSVAKGVKVLPPTMADSLFSQIVERAIERGTVDQVIAAVKLSNKEHVVISLLAQGRSVVSIALEQKVAVYTVKGHVRDIMDKLALHTRLELASTGLRKA